MTPIDTVTLAADPPEAESDPTRGIQVQAARKTVDEAAGAAQLVGGVFVVLSILLVIPVFQGRMRFGMQVLAVATAVMLVGPGAWYVLAASLLRRLDRRAADVAVRVALVQGALVAVGLGVAIVGARGAMAAAARPALLAIFFMPALAALAYHLRRAREAMNHLGGGEAGFEALAPRPVLPLEAADAPTDLPAAPPPHPLQGSDSFRSK